MFICSKNLEYLKTIPDNTYDSIVTDAPYGLGKEPDAVKVLQAWITTGYYEIGGKGFMGKEWDAFVPQPLFWKEVIRVLKPGGHVLCFFGTRTYDWGVMAMRLAGFEIRDQIDWLYGQGFPKSLNVSVAIDKELGAEREVIGKREHPTLKDKSKINRQGNQQFHGENNIKDEWDVTGPNSDYAKQFDGFGTALKPAHEPIVMARKPLSGTVAKTVLEHGTGGINIDGCRIPFAGDTDLRLLYGGGTDILRGNYVGATHGNGKENIEANDLGRWPANVIIDEEAATMIDQQTGKLTSGAMTKSYEYTNNGFSLGKPSGSTKQIHEANSGGGSRFFYCAKPSKEERNKGCEQMEQKPSGVKNASGRGYSESDPYKQVLNQNTHPTVKPISLMRYLVKMVTPPGGHCCDPFIGSGTTHIACELEGFECTGIDDDQESILIAKARSKGWADEIAAAAYLRTHPKAPPESVKNLTADQISFLAGNIQTSLFL